MNGNPPTGVVSAAYAKATKIDHKFPVTSDPKASFLSLTPYDGLARPGKCVLTPKMVMLMCYVGDDDTAGLAAIEADAKKP